MVILSRLNIRQEEDTFPVISHLTMLRVMEADLEMFLLEF